MTVDPQKAIGFQTDEALTTCTERESILYALGIGFSRDPLNDTELPYTYELHDEYKVFPTYATCLHNTDILKALGTIPGLPNFNPMMLLHGEQRLNIFKPIQPQAKYITRGKVIDLADKGKGALLQFELSSYEVSEGKETLSFSQVLSLFIRGLGGFGFKGNPIEQIPLPPKREPCKVVKEKTDPNQAILYRLSGDINPLHIDPNMAAMGNFEKPILHGLCTYGICAKAIVYTFLKGDGNQLKSFNARFTSHVFPGETILISMWKDGNKVSFSAKTEERGLDVIVGVAVLNENAKL